MENSFLISILSSLTRKEMTYFKEFVFSPYYNKHDDVRSLTDYLSNLYPNFTEKNCDPNQIHKAVFGKKKFEKKKLSLVFTYTLRLVEKFMATEIFKEEEYKHKIYSNKFLCNREQFKHSKKQMSQLGELLKKGSLRDFDYYHNKLEEARANDYAITAEGKVLPISLFLEKQFLLDVTFLTEKIENACQQLARDRVLKREISFDIDHFGIREIFENPEKYQEIPSIRTYHSIFKMLDNWSEEDYYEAKKLCLLYTSPSPRDRQKSRMPSSA